MSKSASLRRIKADIRELSIDPSDQYYAAPLENDMFEWHFTIRGAEDTDFAGGVYHGRILLPPEYPFKPPNIVFMTPSGRFECGVKVCLSFSAHHPELWQPAWGIRLILEAIISFLPTPADGALGSLDWKPAERKKLATESVKFRCLTCCARGETCADLLPKIKPRGVDAGGDADEGGVKRPTLKFHEECEKLKLLQFQNHAIVEDKAAAYSKINHVEQSTLSEVAAVEETQSTQPTQLLAAEESLPEPSRASNVEVQCEEDKSDLVELTEKMDEIPKKDDTVTQLNAQISAASQRTVPQMTTAPTDSPVDVANINHDKPVISDGVLHGMIGFFAIIVIFLLRQTQTLIDELGEEQ